MEQRFVLISMKLVHQEVLSLQLHTPLLFVILVHLQITKQKKEEPYILKALVELRYSKVLLKETILLRMELLIILATHRLIPSHSFMQAASYIITCNILGQFSLTRHP